MNKHEKIYHCAICNKQFVDYTCNKRKLCSRQCVAIYHSRNSKGKIPYKMTFDIKRKISKTLLGKFTREKNPTWKGGRYLNEGYVYILTPNHPFAKKNGYVAEHRLVLEKELGRYLTKTESPHHINKKRDDNRIENLMLLKTKKAHIRVDKGLSISTSDIVYKHKE